MSMPRWCGKAERGRGLVGAAGCARCTGPVCRRSAVDPASSARGDSCSGGCPVVHGEEAGARVTCAVRRVTRPLRRGWDQLRAIERSVERGACEVERAMTPRTAADALCSRVRRLPDVSAHTTCADGCIRRRSRGTRWQGVSPERRAGSRAGRGPCVWCPAGVRCRPATRRACAGG